MIRFLLLCFGICLLMGCKESGPTVIPVQGAVTLNGQPVEKANVLFMPDAGQPQAAAGITDAQGKFSLTTFIGPKEYPGALPGAYKIVVTKSNMSGAVADSSGLSIDGMAANIQVEWIVPEKYSKPDTSGLSANVTPKIPSVQLDLVK
jgi:hypothetical protein